MLRSFFGYTNFKVLLFIIFFLLLVLPLNLYFPSLTTGTFRVLHLIWRWVRHNYGNFLNICIHISHQFKVMVNLFFIIFCTTILRKISSFHKHYRVITSKQRIMFQMPVGTLRYSHYPPRVHINFILNNATSQAMYPSYPPLSSLLSIFL